MSETIWVAILGGSAVSAVVTGIFNLITEKKKQSTGIGKGVQLLLLGEIERQTDKYCAAKKISRKELKWFLELYGAYKALGGDGYADDMKSDVVKLPIEN